MGGKWDIAGCLSKAYRRVDAELKITASARTVPRTMPGYALQTSIVLLLMVLEGQMRNLKRKEEYHIYG